MEFLDTPNPNAKKLIIQHNFEIAKNLSEEELENFPDLLALIRTNGVVSLFTGPNFLTIMKKPEIIWKNIIQDFNSNLDKIQ